jgi:hypothetical protein
MLQMKQARMKGSEKGDGDACARLAIEEIAKVCRRCTDDSLMSRYQKHPRENLQLYLWRSGRVSRASAS